MTERRACHLSDQTRSTQHYNPIIHNDDQPLTAAIVSLSGQYDHYGYCPVTALLRAEGWHVNHERVGRIW